MIQRSNGKKYHGRAKRGSLITIVDKLKFKHSVPPEINVSIETVRTRSRRGRPVAIKGHISPLAEVKEYIVDIASSHYHRSFMLVVLRLKWPKITNKIAYYYMRWSCFEEWL
jgi:hypothetical protein